nr:sulfate permease [uncultured Desulfobulbus sp.]
MKLPSRRNLHAFFPFLNWWPMVNRHTLRDDLLAGATGALVVLPQGVAFATIAGLPPEYGLYAAMVPTVIAALFGSSWHLVSGPTTAISVALYAVLSQHFEPGSSQYISMALTLTFMAGVFQAALGLARMGALVNFISHSVVIGFTAGAALLIAASQIRHFFGIEIERGVPLYEIFHQLFLQIGNIKLPVLSISLVTLATGIVIKRCCPKIPFMVAAMVVGSVTAVLLNYWLGAAATGIRTVGALPAHLPPLSHPDLSLESLQFAVAPALVITMLGLTEAVAIARAISVRSEQCINGNQEFIGQGLANIIGSFFSGYSSSGSFNRSGVNFEAGAKTPLASVFASFLLLLLLLVVGRLAAYLPNAAMAGILFLVAWGLIDFHHIRHIWQTSKAEAIILLCTFSGTLVSIEAGIFSGVFLSLVVYLYRASKPEIMPMVPATETGAYHFVLVHNEPECPQLKIVRINGPVFFGSAGHVQQALRNIDSENPQCKSVLIAAASFNYIDIAGAEALAQEARRRRRQGGGIYFYRLKESIYEFLRQGDYLKDFGEDAFFPVKTHVTGAIYWKLNPDICRTCKVRIFTECNLGVLPGGLRRQRIMLATDGSAFSHAPETVAIALAKAFGVKLDVMTSVETPESDEIATANLEQASRKAEAAGVEYETCISYGKDPVEQVVSTAREMHTNILIIGRRPLRGDMKERLIGDVAQQILVGSPCHVLVANWQVQPWKKHILIAVEDSQISETVIEVAVQIAKASKLPVTLLTSVAAESKREKAEEQLAAKLDLLKAENIEAKGHIVVGKTPDRAIIETSGEIGADLVIIGNDQRKGLARKIAGPTTDRVVVGLSCAVLVVKRAPEPSSLTAAVRQQA